MAAIIGGTVGGLILVGALIVGIIVPLLRRRWLRKQVMGRVPVNLDLPLEKESKPDARLLPIGGEMKHCPTIDSGARSLWARESDVAGLIPLLGRGGDLGSPQAHSTFSSSIRQGGSVISQPPSIRYPTVSSTHMYQRPLPPPHEQEQQRHDDLYFYCRTASSATGGVAAGGLGGLGGQQDSEAEVEFDPYAHYMDKPSPLDAIRDSMANRTVDPERPARALTPSSPKKTTRTLPEPFEDDLGNPFVVESAIHSYSNPFTSPPGTALYESKAPFSSSPPPIPVATGYQSATTTQAKVDNATIRGSQYFTSNALSVRNRSPSPKRPSFFSYRSSSTPASVRGGPPLPPGAQQPLPRVINPFLSPPPPPPPSLISGNPSQVYAEAIPFLPALDLGGPVREASGDSLSSFQDVANAKVFPPLQGQQVSSTITTTPNQTYATAQASMNHAMMAKATTSADHPSPILTNDSDSLSMYSQMSPVGSLRRDSVVIHNPFLGSVESTTGTDRRSFVGSTVSSPFFGSVGSTNGLRRSFVGSVEHAEAMGLGLRAVEEGPEEVFVRRKAVRTHTTQAGGVSGVGRAGIRSFRGDVVGTIQLSIPDGTDEHGRQATTPIRGEDVQWLVPPPHMKEASSASSNSTSSSFSGSNSNVHSNDRANEHSTEAKGTTSLSRMDTLAIGNLIKTRAATIVVSGQDGGKHHHERLVSMIERKGSIRGVDDAVEGAHQGLGGSQAIDGVGREGHREPIVRGRGIKKGEEAEERGEGYGAIRRVPVKRTVTPTTTAPSTNATPARATSASASNTGTTPSPGNNIIRRRSRSQSRGRLIPKVSLKRPSTAEGHVNLDDGVAKGGANDDESISQATSTPVPIGRNPSRKYKPKMRLQQKLIEKGLLSVSTPDSLEGDKSMTMVVTSSPPVSSPAGPALYRRQHRRTESAPTKPPTATQLQAPSSSSSPRAQGAKPRLELSTSTSSPSTTPNPNPNRNTLFPLTGAFGLAQTPSARSPATPTYQYAFADLERTKEFLPVTEPLKVVMGPRASPSAQGNAEGKGKLRKGSAGGGGGAKEGK
ncbi:hypothetical protein EST38_g9767 [Candolleomyces aberdarensis]|uniref:Uncharacterized protein n=1 Tax=Candolleomyces aberdarensis TaxID=2316362 RepID=A0A4Q2DBB1_9AGAR|nr:hypothetical protein EST38_g9767 [Candolleomyces aberdarensis]